jgi:hypothetical protein
VSEPLASGGPPKPGGGNRPAWLVPVLIPLITLIVVGAALGALWAVKSGDPGQDVSADQTTIVGPPTSIIVASTTESVVSTTDTLPETTSTTLPETTTTGPETQTTLGDAGDKWQKSGTSLADLRTQIAQALPDGQAVYLPDHLPQGWDIAAPGQVFGEIAAGYFTDMHTNPSLISLDGDTTSPAEYVVAFTDGTEVVGELVVVGDWGDVDFKEVTAYGKKLYVYEDDTLVAILIPGWEQGTLVASPGAREAALEIAAAIKAW